MCKQQLTKNQGFHSLACGMRIELSVFCQISLVTLHLKDKQPVWQSEKSDHPVQVTWLSANKRSTCVSMQCIQLYGILLKLVLVLQAED